MNAYKIRQLHRALVPFVVLPLLITLTTGTAFQFAVAANRAEDFLWLLDLHRGKFGSVNLELIYPILNALGLLTLIITGLFMWLNTTMRRRTKV
jgi:hypothetical protein